MECLKSKLHGHSAQVCRQADIRRTTGLVLNFFRVFASCGEQAIIYYSMKFSLRSCLTECRSLLPQCRGSERWRTSLLGVGQVHQEGPILVMSSYLNVLLGGGVWWEEVGHSCAYLWGSISFSCSFFLFCFQSVLNWAAFLCQALPSRCFCLTASWPLTEPPNQ